MVKNLPEIQETQVQSLGREDPLEKEMVIHSSILAGKLHGQKRLASYSPWGCKDLDMTERLLLHFTYTYIYIYVCVCVCVLIKTTENMLTKRLQLGISLKGEECRSYTLF